MRLKKILWIIAAFVTFGLGTLGTVLPVLPTVPFYLLTAFCFAQSSSRLHNWFLHTGLYKRYLAPYLAAKGLPLKAKIPLILFVTAELTIAAILLRHSLIALLIIAAVYLGFMISMLFIVKTVPGEKRPPKS